MADDIEFTALHKLSAIANADTTPLANISDSISELFASMVWASLYPIIRRMCYKTT